MNDLVALCAAQDTHGLAEAVQTRLHVDGYTGLRVVLPPALQHCHNPLALVLECMEPLSADPTTCKPAQRLLVEALSSLGLPHKLQSQHYDILHRVWVYFDSGVLGMFLRTLTMDDPCTRDEQLAYIRELMANGAHKEAADFTAETHLQDHISPESILRPLIAAGKFDVCERYIGQDLAMRRLFVHLVMDKDNTTLAIKFVKRWNLDINAFPKLKMAYFFRVSKWLIETERFSMLDDLLEEHREDMDKKHHRRVVEMLVKAHAEVEVLESYAHRFGLTDQFVEQIKKLRDQQHDRASSAPQPMEHAFLSLPLSDDRIHVVDTVDGLRYAQDVLTGTDVVGLDAEWKPIVTPAGKQRCAILQIATRNDIFIFDLLSLEHEGAHENLLAQMFLSPSILKLGFGFRQDLKLLASSAPDLRCFQQVNSYLDLRDMNRIITNGQFERECSSLSKMCSVVLGKPLSKRQQVSNWEKRPLSVEQIHYAALDAFCLLLLAETLFTRAHQVDTASSLGRAIMNEREIEPALVSLNVAAPHVSSSLHKATPPAPAPEKTELLNPTPEEVQCLERPIKFVVDNMMLGLARQLRGVGIDATFSADEGVSRERTLVNVAEKEGRVILTRDRQFASRRYGPLCYCVNGNRKQDQLAEVLSFFNIKVVSDDLLSRCTKCNAPVSAWIPRTVDEVQERVGDEIASRIDAFWECACGQIYWEGVKFFNALETFGVHTTPPHESGSDLAADKGTTP